jgi:hypothetical protein
MLIILGLLAILVGVLASWLIIRSLLKAIRWRATLCGKIAEKLPQGI